VCGLQGTLKERHDDEIEAYDAAKLSRIELSSDGGLPSGCLRLSQLLNSSVANPLFNSSYDHSPMVACTHLESAGMANEENRAVISIDQGSL
jgi:hypothetical protein